MKKSVLNLFARSFLIMPILLLGMLSIVPTAYAVDPTPAPVVGCRCFCQTNSGANPVNSDPKVKTTPKDCAASCAATNKNNKSSCAFSIDQYPERTLQCFTKAQCELPYAGDDKTLKGKVLGLFDGTQPPECPSIPTIMHYCYPNPAVAPPLTLNVAIGTLKTTINVGEYINAVYYWMLGAGITISVVMIMIAGLQYVLGAGGGSAAKTAKKRISDATIGLVLLLCVNLILNTVNPYLIRLQVPKLPMLKTVALLKDNLSCEKLNEKFNLTDTEGNDLKDISGKKCGDSALVKEAKDHTTVVAGTTCDFSTCPSAAEGCLGIGTKAKCLKCEDVTFQNKEQPPSSDVCAALQAKLPDETKQNKINYCFYSHDPSVTVSAADEAGIIVAIGLAGVVSGPAALAVGGAVTANYADNIRVGTCARMQVDCNQIKTCDNYDNNPHATSAIANKDIEGFYINSLWGDMNLKKLCESNPCNLQAKADDGKIIPGVPQTSVCKLNELKIVGNDCIPNATASAAVVEVKAGSCDPSKCTAPSHCITDGPHKGCASSCGVIMDDNKLANGETISPSPSSCDLFTTSKFNICGYTTDSDMTSVGTNSNGSCAMFAIFCPSIKTCDDYKNVPVTNANSKDLAHVTGGNGETSFASICMDNPCGVPKGCTYQHNSVFDDKCLSK